MPHSIKYPTISLSGWRGGAALAVETTAMDKIVNRESSAKNRSERLSAFIFVPPYYNYCHHSGSI
jgi:hypothetical protein